MQSYLSPFFPTGNEIGEDQLDVSFQPVDNASAVCPFQAAVSLAHALSLRSA